MDRRVFLLSGVAGVAAPLPAPFAPLAGPPPTHSGDAGFDDWALGFLGRAAALGAPESLVRAQLSGLTPDPRVIQLDRRQPEFTRPVGDYMRAAVSASRIEVGRRKRAETGAWLEAIRTRFAVEPGVLVGIWGIESGFGVEQGGFDVLRSLATLASDGRRRGWAEGELVASLKLIAAGRARREQLVGSWAGAMGQTQLEPSELLTKGVDVDGDRRVDIWASPADALGSTANILKLAGWRAGESWAREVRLPDGFDYLLAEGPKQPLGFWTDKGVRPAGGRPWAAADQASPCQLLLPAGAAGPAFLAFPNHFVIRAYNNSMSYALAVGLVADGVLGLAPVSAPWPAEAPLSSEDRSGAQAALKALGFDPGDLDGVIGPQTRAALRRWQAGQGLVPDGHLTHELAARLRAQAPAPSPVS